MATHGRQSGGDGPDWEDVLNAVHSVNAHHQVVCFITVTPDDVRRGHLQVVVSATPAGPSLTIAEALDGTRWAVEGSLPVVGRDSFASRVWSLLISLDHLLSRERWAQLPLDGA